MPVRDRFRILAPSVIVGSCLLAAPALAENCAESDCRLPAVKAEEPQQPIRLDKFRRKQVALGKTARVVKTPDGRYARLKSKRRPKVKPTEEAKTAPPQFMPVVVSPEAAAALAMQASVAQAAAQVRVVEANEVNEIDRAADTPLVPVIVPTTSEPPFRVASADQDNTPERNDATPPEGPTASMTADRVAQVAPVALAAEQPGFDLRAWLSRLGSWLSDTWSALVASVRSRFA